MEFNPPRFLRPIRLVSNMDWCTFYSELKEWQTALTGIAAIIAAVMAYKFALKRDQTFRKNQVRSIAAAIYGELTALVSDLEDAAGMLQFAIGKNKVLTEVLLRLHVPMQSEIRNSLGEQLGKLPPDLVTKLTLFYQRVDIVRRAISVVMEDANLHTHSIAARSCISALESAEELQTALEKIVNYSHKQNTRLRELSIKMGEIEENLNTPKGDGGEQ